MKRIIFIFSSIFIADFRIGHSFRAGKTGGTSHNSNSLAEVGDTAGVFNASGEFVLYSNLSQNTGYIGDIFCIRVCYGCRYRGQSLGGGRWTGI